MKIHFLGTNGWYDTAAGETVCTLIDAEEAYIILDAGNGLRKIDEHIGDTNKPIFIFLSHFHLDHCFGLHILPKFSFPQGVSICGQPGTKEVLNRLIAPPFTASLEHLCKKMNLEVLDLREGANALETKTKLATSGQKQKTKILNLETRYLVHADPCFGYSFSLEGKKVSYCTDTGVCDNMIALARDADLLISECSWKTRNQSPDWPHLAPEDAAEVARKANAKRLALTHFDAAQYKKRSERIEAQRKARKIFPNSFAAEDDLVLEL